MKQDDIAIPHRLGKEPRKRQSTIKHNKTALLVKQFTVYVLLTTGSIYTEYTAKMVLLETMKSTLDLMLKPN